MKSHFNLLLLLIVLHINTAYADAFPHRDKFGSVSVIEIDDLYSRLNDVLIIDVRSEYEYSTIRINNSINIPLSSEVFEQRLRDTVKEYDIPIVFYCNGVTCLLSYEATSRAKDAGFKETYAFDAGMFAWAEKYPDHATLLGASPINRDKLIGKNKLDLHMLSLDDFAARLYENGILLDIRPTLQRDGISLFPMQRSHFTDLDNESIFRMVVRANESGKSLMFIDEVGRQVRWVQYYLEDIGFSDYYFLKDGVNGALREMIPR